MSNNKSEDEAGNKGGHHRGRATMVECVEGAFRNSMAAANEATKHLKTKICCGHKRLQNVVKNTTINKKRAALMEGR